VHNECVPCVLCLCIMALWLLAWLLICVCSHRCCCFGGINYCLFVNHCLGCLAIGFLADGKGKRAERQKDMMNEDYDNFYLTCCMTLCCGCYCDYD